MPQPIIAITTKRENIEPTPYDHLGVLHSGCHKSRRNTCPAAGRDGQPAGGADRLLGGWHPDLGRGRYRPGYFQW